jgi:hypothetical protein
MRIHILVSSRRTAWSARRSQRIIIISHSACCNRTVRAKSIRKTGAYSTSAKTILTAPVRANLSWIRTKIIEIWTDQWPLQSAQSLYRSCLSAQTSDIKRANVEYNTGSAASIGIASTEKLARHVHSAKSTANTERISSIDLISESLEIWGTDTVGVSTVVIGNINTTTVSHVCCLRTAYSLASKSRLTVWVCDRLRCSIAKLCKGSWAVACIQYEWTAFFIAVVRYLCKSVVS